MKPANALSYYYQAVRDIHNSPLISYGMHSKPIQLSRVARDDLRLFLARSPNPIAEFSGLVDDFSGSIEAYVMAMEEVKKHQNDFGWMDQFL